MSEAKQLFAEDFRLGDRFEGKARPLAREAFMGFAEITGDAHPIHYDAAYAKAHGFDQPVAHGLLTMAMTALGATPMAERLIDSMIAFLSQSADFKRPAFAGDTLRTTFQVQSVALEPERQRGRIRFDVRLHNQHGDLILEGHHAYLLRTRAGRAKDRTHGDTP